MNLIRNQLAVAVVLALLAAPAVWGQCASSFSITGPTVITQPGCHTVANPIPAPSGAPMVPTIRISVSNVVLDLSGYSVAAALNRAVISIDNALDNITIRNGQLLGGINAIQAIIGGDNWLIEDLQIQSSSDLAILIQDGTNLVVRRNQLENVGNGILLNGVLGQMTGAIDHNQLRNSDGGITVSGGRGVAITDNLIDSISPVLQPNGINVLTSNGVNIARNTITGTSNHGISVTGSGATQVTNNVVTGAGGHGISLVGSNACLVSDNLTNANTLTGIRVSGSFNRIEGNTANSNGQSNIWIDGITGAAIGNSFGKNGVTSGGTLPGPCASSVPLGCNPASICLDGIGNISFGDNVGGTGPC